MNTHTLQRSRFARHAAAALSHLAATTLRFVQGTSAPATTLSAADRASLEAQEVREMARSYMRTQPGFASELAAAADRHELQHAE